jgi:hypothetical protein
VNPFQGGRLVHHPRFDWPRSPLSMSSIAADRLNDRDHANGVQGRIDNSRSAAHRPGHSKTHLRPVAEKNFGEGWNLPGALREEWTHVFDLWKQTAFGPETSRSPGRWP